MSLSGCGNYMAKVNKSSVEITDGAHNWHYDVAQTIRQQLDISSVISRAKVIWEPVRNRRSTQLAVVTDEFVVVYVIGHKDGVVIVQEDGVESMVWIPSVQKDGTQIESTQKDGTQIESVQTASTQTTGTQTETNGLGAYTTPQLLIYTKNYLQVKLYSLDCTHMLWKLSCPITKTPTFTPGTRLWSVLVLSRSPQVDDSRPVLYQFFNSGPTSDLLRRFTLPLPYLTTPLIVPHVSGKYFAYFNCQDTLFGFTLQVFNNLGVKGNAINDSIPDGDPMIDINWLTEGIMGDSPVITGNKQYFICGLTVDEEEEEDEGYKSEGYKNEGYKNEIHKNEGYKPEIHKHDYFVVISSLTQSLEMLTVSIKDFRIIENTNIDIKGKTWRGFYNGGMTYFMENGVTEAIISNIFSIGNDIYVEVDTGIIVVDFITKQVKMIIEAKIKRVIVKDKVYLVVGNHIVEVNNDNVEVIYESESGREILEVEVGETISVMDEQGWRRIKEKEIKEKEIIEKERNILPRHLYDMEEGTDTFQMYKRRKVEDV